MAAGNLFNVHHCMWHDLIDDKGMFSPDIAFHAPFGFSLPCISDWFLVFFIGKNKPIGDILSNLTRIVKVQMELECFDSYQNTKLSSAIYNHISLPQIDYDDKIIEKMQQKAIIKMKNTKENNWAYLREGALL